MTREQAQALHKEADLIIARLEVLDPSNAIEAQHRRYLVPRLHDIHRMLEEYYAAEESQKMVEPKKPKLYLIK